MAGLDSVQDERRRIAREADAQRDAESGGGEQVGQVVPPVEVAKHGHAQEEGFAASTAAVTGQTKKSVNRAIRRATAVCQEARDLIRGTALDTGSYLDGLAKKDLTNEGGSPEPTFAHE